MDWREVVQRVEDSPVTGWVIALLIVIIGLIVANRVARGIRALGRERGSVATAVSLVARVVQSLIVIIAIATALNLVGIDLGPVLASAGVVGIIVGFGLKDIAENYIAGVILAFRRVFLIGDEIMVSDKLTGRVEELSLRYIRLRTRDGLRVYLPNAAILKEPLVNLTRNGSRRGEFHIAVSYDTDLDRAREIAEAAVEKLDGFGADSRPAAYVTEFGTAAVTLLIHYWYDPDQSAPGKRSRAMIAVKKAFETHGVDLPSSAVEVKLGPGQEMFPTDPVD
ncbi:mechanosensitive ion channel family protein [Corynebacterium sp.]|uniref:mechanosensitive ion channel family protein n=1 Tax=Corynebacterium sp. TaxID=1720 RepID=UPI0026DF4ABE|nr:mechanosensitive ion channel family protein [Corynebacterium sp.]MDO5513423.1 mechanosensitive ion channel family protein [Corynebacterium sp.]